MCVSKCDFGVVGLNLIFCVGGVWVFMYVLFVFMKVCIFLLLFLLLEVEFYVYRFDDVIRVVVDF